MQWQLKKAVQVPLQKKHHAQKVGQEFLRDWLWIWNPRQDIDPGNSHSLLNQESPRQTKPKKGPKREVHEFCPFLWILVFFLGKTSTIHIELLFRNAPAKRSWTDLSLVWFAGVTPDSSFWGSTGMDGFHPNPSRTSLPVSHRPLNGPC